MSIRSTSAPGASNMCAKFVLALAIVTLTSPAWAFGFTLGPQIEEKFGSEYGSDQNRTVSHCGDKGSKWPARESSTLPIMFFLFSNRLACTGSLAISLLLTILLLKACAVYSGYVPPGMTG